MASPQLSWDWGTAYDLFMSLEVLHNPADFGVRGAWAAGVRARLPTSERETLEHSLLLFGTPLHWLPTLPAPKDTMTVLWTLGQTPAAERLSLLGTHYGTPEDAVKVLQNVAARGAWSEGDQELLQAAYECPESKCPSPEELTRILESWAHAEEYGERYLEALRGYHEVFFAEEESRIAPALQKALARGQELAGQLELQDLLEELSQGLRFEELPEMSELTLVPSFWITPLMLFGKVDAERAVWLFGARPADASLVPGEVVPDAMLRVLKALSDPTRLRILRYLAEEPLSPAKLARRLRLRAPTVTHHLKTLRLAGLVQLTLTMEKGKEAKHLATRTEAVCTACASLKDFLGIDQSESTQ